MKKTLSRLPVALTVSRVAQAAFEDNTQYAGAKLGWSQYQPASLTMMAQLMKPTLGAGAFGGYRSYTYVGFSGNGLRLVRPYVNAKANGAYKAQGRSVDR